MALSTTNLTPVDFETIKSNLKSYLSSQAAFKDYDFESSNINVLLEVLAYNTYHNAFYMNMVASEMFLDTAQLRDSVVSHSKMLNYLPQSYTSAKAVVNIAVSPSSPSNIESILIPKGATFTTRVGSNNYTFSTSENVVLMNNNNTFAANNLSLYEGRYLSETFVYSDGSRYVLSNPNIDTSSISVVMIESGREPISYNRSSTFLDVSGESLVYFVQPAENGQYEILFGDDTFGKKPTPGTGIIVEYRVSNGELPNGAAVFESDGTIGGTANIAIETVLSATGGAVAETIDQIKFRAPLAFATQDRAITTSDYSNLIQRQFPDISRVSVFGGEELDPPRFGYVVISMVSDSYDAISITRQNDVIKYITERAPITVTPIAINPEFTYTQVTTNVRYNVNDTTKSAEDIKLLTLSAIKTYAKTEINDFDTTLRYSKLLSQIDNADPSIISNDTDVLVYKIIVPVNNEQFTVALDYHNELFDGPASTLSHMVNDLYTIRSTYFTYDGKRCLFEDDGNGSIGIYTTIGGDHVMVKANVGTVNYTTGFVTMNDVVVSAYEGDGIRIYARTKYKDISATKNNILVIKDADVVITTTPTRL